jgi:hypothetical protein
MPTTIASLQTSHRQQLETNFVSTGSGSTSSVVVASPLSQDVFFSSSQGDQQSSTELLAAQPTYQTTQSSSFFITGEPSSPSRSETEQTQPSETLSASVSQHSSDSTETLVSSNALSSSLYDRQATRAIASTTSSSKLSVDSKLLSMATNYIASTSVTLSQLTQLSASFFSLERSLTVSFSSVSESRQTVSNAEITLSGSSSLKELSTKSLRLVSGTSTQAQSLASETASSDFSVMPTQSITSNSIQASGTNFFSFTNQPTTLVADKVTKSVSDAVNPMKLSSTKVGHKSTKTSTTTSQVSQQEKSSTSVNKSGKPTLSTFPSVKSLKHSATATKTGASALWTSLNGSSSAKILSKKSVRTTKTTSLAKISVLSTYSSSAELSSEQSVNTIKTRKSAIFSSASYKFISVSSVVSKHKSSKPPLLTTRTKKSTVSPDTTSTSFNDISSSTVSTFSALKSSKHLVQTKKVKTSSTTSKDSSHQVSTSFYAVTSTLNGSLDLRSTVSFYTSSSRTHTAFNSKQTTKVSLKTSTASQAKKQVLSTSTGLELLETPLPLALSTALSESSLTSSIMLSSDIASTKWSSSKVALFFDPSPTIYAQSIEFAAVSSDSAFPLSAEVSPDTVFSATPSVVIIEPSSVIAASSAISTLGDITTSQHTTKSSKIKKGSLVTAVSSRTIITSSAFVESSDSVSVSEPATFSSNDIFSSAIAKPSFFPSSEVVFTSVITVLPSSSPAASEVTLLGPFSVLILPSYIIKPSVAPTSSAAFSSMSVERSFIATHTSATFELSFVDDSTHIFVQPSSTVIEPSSIEISSAFVPTSATPTPSFDVVFSSAAILSKIHSLVDISSSLVKLPTSSDVKSSTAPNFVAVPSEASSSAIAIQTSVVETTSKSPFSKPIFEISASSLAPTGSVSSEDSSFSSVASAPEYVSLLSNLTPSSSIVESHFDLDSISTGIEIFSTKSGSISVFTPITSIISSKDTSLSLTASSVTGISATISTPAATISQFFESSILTTASMMPSGISTISSLSFQSGTENILSATVSGSVATDFSTTSTNVITTGTVLSGTAHSSDLRSLNEPSRTIACSLFDLTSLSQSFSILRSSDATLLGSHSVSETIATGTLATLSSDSLVKTAAFSGLVSSSGSTLSSTLGKSRVFSSGLSQSTSAVISRSFRLSSATAASSSAIVSNSSIQSTDIPFAIDSIVSQSASSAFTASGHSLPEISGSNPFFTKSSFTPTFVPFTPSTSYIGNSIVTNVPSTSSNWLPDVLIVQTYSSNTDSNESVSATSTGKAVLASFLPKAISPYGDEQQNMAPKNSISIQIGFQHPLNYPFVVANPLSAAQIFRYLPAGLAYGLGIDAANVSMRSIQPYESETANYVISVALVFIPKSSLSLLESQISVYTSTLYQNPDSSIKNLMNLIDPSIPLFPSYKHGSNGSPDSSGHDTGEKGTGKGNIDDSKAGLPDSGSLDQPVSNSTTVHSKTAGIAAGTIAGAMAYCGAVFLVARHYRQRKKSVELEGSSSPVMATMARPQLSSSGIRPPISVPLQSENSLGWR